MELNSRDRPAAVQSEAVTMGMDAACFPSGWEVRVAPAEDRADLESTS